MKTEKWISKNTTSLTGKTVAISGSTGGLGSALCHHLASLGATLILVDRNIEKSRRLASEIKNKYDVTIDFVTADMTDVESVRAAGERLSSMGIDYLILNAGAYSIPRKILESGYDNVFQINFVSPYYLARRLIDGIRARGGRIIAVGSIAHGYSETDTSDVDFRRRNGAGLIYGNSKRYLTFALQDLSKGDVVVAHPGISFTGITDHYPPLLYAIIKHPMRLIFMNPKRASLSILYALFASCPSDSWIGPAIFDVWGLPRVKKLRTAGAGEKAGIVKIANEIYENTK